MSPCWHVDVCVCVCMCMSMCICVCVCVYVCVNYETFIETKTDVCSTHQLLDSEQNRTEHPHQHSKPLSTPHAASVLLHKRTSHPKLQSDGSFPTLERREPLYLLEGSPSLASALHSRLDITPSLDPSLPLPSAAPRSLLRLPHLILPPLMAAWLPVMAAW